MIIYKVINLINNKVYIGLTKQTLEKRKHQHELHANKKPIMVLHYAIRKYGKENFSWEIIKQCNNLEELNKSEKEFINLFNSTKKENGYNRTTGGENPVMTLETRKKMSLSQKKRYEDPMVKKQWSEFMKLVCKNNPITQETKNKIGLSNSISLKGKKQSKETKEKRKQSTKIFWSLASPEYKASISKKIWEKRRLNKTDSIKLSEETKLKISKGNFGKKRSKKSRIKYSIAAKLREQKKREERKNE